MSIKFAGGVAPVALMVSLTLCGCGGGGADVPELGSVTGTVTVDGTPIEGATVEFIPQAGGRPSTATTDAQGKYELQWSGENMGAAIGTHKVVIRTERAGFSPEGDEGVAVEARPELLPPEYNDDSTLNQEVAAGDQTIDFALETKGFKPGQKRRPVNDA